MGKGQAGPLDQNQRGDHCPRMSATSVSLTELAAESPGMGLGPARESGGRWMRMPQREGDPGKAGRRRD